jgi:hypothetical protein
MRTKSGKLPELFDNGFQKSNPEREIIIDPDSEDVFLIPFDVSKDWKKDEEGRDYLEVWSEGSPSMEEKFSEVTNGLKEELEIEEPDQIIEEKAVIELDDITARTEATFDLKRFGIGLLKIAFEYAYFLLGEDYRDDPVFKNYQEALSKILTDDQFYEEWKNNPIFPWPINGKVMVTTGRTFLSPQISRVIPKYHRHSHVICAPRINGSTYCYISIFGGLEAMLQISQEIHPTENNTNSPYIEYLPTKTRKEDQLGNVLSGPKLITRPIPRRIFERNSYWYTPESETMASTNIRLNTVDVKIPENKNN